MTEGIETIIDEIRQTKRELKSLIEAVEVRITLKIEDLNRRLNKVEKQNKLFEEKIEQLERKSRENNIIIFGLKHPAQNISLDFLTSELKKLIGVEVKETDLKNYYTLGKTETAPIKVEFLSFFKKSSILSNSKKLKGTNTIISNDLTDKQREEGKILRKHLSLARQDNNTNCFIRRNKLHVNNKVYTLEELEGNEEFVEIEEASKINSAPGTPSPSSQITNSEELKTSFLPVFSPITTVSDSTRKYPKEASQQKPKKENEDKPKVETRSTKLRNDTKSSLNRNRI